VDGCAGIAGVLPGNSVYREGSNWVQEMTGDLGAAKNLRVKLAAGSVHMQGGAQDRITYVIHRKAYTSSEQEARRELSRTGSARR